MNCRGVSPVFASMLSRYAWKDMVRSLVVTRLRVEEFLLDAGRGVDAHHLQRALALCAEPVRGVGPDDEDVADAGTVIDPVGRDGDLALEHHPRLGVRVLVQVGALAGLVVDEEERDARPVGLPLELHGAPGTDREVGGSCGRQHVNGFLSSWKAPWPRRCYDASVLRSADTYE